MGTGAAAPTRVYQPTATRAPWIMNWSWAKIPRPMQRTFADDLKWAVAVLVGVSAGYVAFGNGDTGLLIGSVIGVTIAIVGLNVARRVSRRPKR